MPFNEQAKFLCYNGEILVFQLSGGEFADLEMPTDPSVLCVKRMIFDRETSTFLVISTVSLNLNEKDSHLKILCCYCVSDFRTRVHLPCILIQCRKYNSKAFKYYILFLHNLNKLEKLLSFELNHALDENTKIFDGPIVFWQDLNQFFYISSEIGKVTNISVKLSSIEWIGEIENFGVGFLGLAEPSEECTHKLSESDYEFSNSILYAYALKSQEMLSNSYLIPLAYSSVVSHVHVCAAEMVDSQLRMSLIALTRKNQLILFQNGIPVRACQLPFLDPRTVQILDAGKRNRFFIVSFPSKACAVSEKKFKVVAKWEQLSLVLVNDFAGVGTEQVLVVFEDSLDADQLTSFTITDFVKMWYSTKPLDCYEDPLAEEEHENYYLVLPALEAQLDNSFIFLNKFKQHISFKDKFIANSWKALLNSVYGKVDSVPSEEEGKLEQGGLVPFCDEEENSVPTPEENLPENCSEPEHIVEQTWCRVLDDDLVVGAKVTSLKPSNEMTLSLIMDQGNRSSFHLVKCQSQVWLLKHMKCERVQDYTEIYLYKKLRNCGALFSWEQRTAFEGILTIHCRSQGVLFQCLDHLIKVLPEICSFKYLKFENEDFLVDHLSSTLEAELVTFCSVSTSAFDYVRGGGVSNCRTRKTDNRAPAFSGRRAKIRQYKREVQREKILKHLNKTVNGSSYAEMTLALAEIQLKSDLIVKSLADL
uniref:Fanconi anemia group B protein isoform X2 n=1 Tax=Arvicanthis niloticus TaxID=61156 RepID=UPI001485D20B|nr:Fanconi anemia group B protein isoform X2 [Arvicanthis niloticus]